MSHFWHFVDYCPGALHGLKMELLLTNIFPLLRKPYCSLSLEYGSEGGEWSGTRDLPGTILSVRGLGPRASYFWLCDLRVPPTPLTLAKSPFIQEMLTLEQNGTKVC